MFEYCGVRDIFIGWWKHKKIIISITIAMALISAGFSLIKNSKAVTTVSYTATKQYFFSSIRSDEEKNTGEIVYSGGQIASIYKNMIDSDSSKEYISDYLNKEGIVINPAEITGYVQSSIAQDGYILLLTVTEPKEDAIEKTFDAYEDYFTTYQKELYNQDKESFSIAGSTAITKNEITNLVDVKKSVLSGIIVGLFVTCLGIMIYCIFNPTMNRKNDFEKMGYCANELIIVHHNIQKYKWKKVGIISSLTNMDEEIKLCCQSLTEREESSIQATQFFAIYPIDIDKIAKMDAVISVEKYTDTSIKKFVDMVTTVEELDVKIAGIVI